MLFRNAEEAERSTRIPSSPLNANSAFEIAVSPRMVSLAE
jgi:hypothetical protein